MLIKLDDRQIMSIQDLLDITNAQHSAFQRIAEAWREAARVLPGRVRVTLASLRVPESEVEYTVNGLRRTMQECAAAVTEAAAGVSAVQCDAELLREDTARATRRLDLRKI